MMLWNYLCEQMRKHSDRTVDEGEASLTYEELIIYAEAFAKKLVGQKCCAIYCKSELAAAMALLGCFAAGVTAVPLSLRYGEAHCRRILDFISPTCIITDNGGEFEICDITDSEYEEPEVHPALIMCTSGTTGTPKGVMLGEENIIANVYGISQYFMLESSDTILIARPLYHCAVLTGEFLCGLIKGANIIFYSEAFNPIEIIKIWRENAITAFAATPTLLSMIARFMRKGEKTSLRHIVVSGECMNEATGREIAVAFPETDIYHVYGLTEACPRVAYMPPKHFAKNPDRVGVPLVNVQLKIVSKGDGEAVETDERGILWVCGDNVMLGYYKNPVLTSKVIRNGWLCTGDIASIDAHGFLKIYGRSDDMIIRAGMNIYPQEIEAELKRDSRVKEVLAYGYTDKNGRTQIGLDICGDFADTNEVHILCSELLPSYQIPTKIHILDSLAKNGSGKILRRKHNERI